IPSVSAACWSCCSALARVSDSRFWSAGTSRPVVRAKTRVCWLSMLVTKSCEAGRVTWMELGEIDARDGLAMDDEEDAVAGEEVGQDDGGFAALDDGVDGVDDGLEAAEALDPLDDVRDGGVDGGGAAGDERGNTREEAGCGVAQEDDHCRGAKNERKQEG